jgi:Zn-dependent protease
VLQQIRRGFVRLFDGRSGIFFPLFGYGVKIQHSFWVLVVVLGARRPDLATLLAWVVVATVSILLHEVGHALVASRWGVVYRIELHAMGGTTAWRGTGPVAWWKDVLVSLAGPAVGLGLGFLMSLLQTPELPFLVRVAIHDLVWVGIGWSLFNLLPVPPLDGGQAVRTTLVRWAGDTGEYVAAVIGVVIAVAAAVAALLLDQVWAALIVAYHGYSSFLVARRHYWSRRPTGWQRMSGPWGR